MPYKGKFFFLWLAIIFVAAFGIASVQDGSVTMREYVDMRFAETQRAIDTAYKALSDKLVGMNEIRGNLADANKTFARADTVEKMQDDIKTLRSLSDIAQGKASQTSLFFVGLVSVLSLAMQVTKIFTSRRKNNQ